MISAFPKNLQSKTKKSSSPRRKELSLEEIKQKSILKKALI